MQQVARNLTDPVDGFLRGATHLIHDRDPLFTDAITAILRSGGVECAKISAPSPNCNPQSMKTRSSMDRPWQGTAERLSFDSLDSLAAVAFARGSIQNRASHVLGDLNLTRSFWFTSPAIAAIVLLAACVDLTPRWAGRQDAASDAAGSGGIFPAGTDAGGGGSGGSATSSLAGGTTADGTATGGTSQAATGGTAGSILVDAGSVADAAGETRGAETGDTVGVVAPDVADVVDATSPQDIGVDVPFSADTNLPSDLGLGGVPK